MLTVFCTKVLTRYGSEYVNRLYAMCKRHLTVPFKFVCTTDDERGIHKDVEWHRPARKCWGWWNLQEAYSDPEWADGPILFFGLDTVVRGNIDCMAKRDRPTFVKGFNHPVWNDMAVFIPEGGPLKFLWDRFKDEIGPEDQSMMHLYNDKLMREAGVTPDWWQDVCPGLLCSFKAKGLKRKEPDANVTRC
jgi:hypothetical protein